MSRTEAAEDSTNSKRQKLNKHLFEEELRSAGIDADPDVARVMSSTTLRLPKKYMPVTLRSTEASKLSKLLDQLTDALEVVMLANESDYREIIGIFLRVALKDTGLYYTTEVSLPWQNRSVKTDYMIKTRQRKDHPGFSVMEDNADGLEQLMVQAAALWLQKEKKKPVLSVHSSGTQWHFCVLFPADKEGAGRIYSSGTLTWTIYKTASVPMEEVSAGDGQVQEVIHSSVVVILGWLVFFADLMRDFSPKVSSDGATQPPTFDTVMQQLQDCIIT